MHFVVVKAWFRKRWHVYGVGHLEGDYFWLATFRNEMAARHWADGTTSTSETLRKKGNSE